MRGLRKKLVALTAVAAMVVTSFTGCAASVENNEVVATVNKAEITAGVANFYTRYQQAQTENMYAMYGMDTKNIWDMEVSKGVTNEEQTKDSIMESLQKLYLLKEHMADYKVELADADNEAIEKAAAAFAKANSKEVQEKISGQKEVVAEVLELLTISEKMYDAMVADVDTNVEDKDAAQKAAQYVLFATTTQDASTGQSVPLSDEQKATKKTEAKNFLDKAKANGTLEAYAKEISLEAKKVTFDKDSTALDEKVIKEADGLALNAFSDVIETDAGYYVLQLTSELDREATDAKKKEIVQERKDDKYNEIVDGWKKDAKIEVFDKVWKKISLDKLGVTIKEEKQEDTTGATSGTSTDDAATDTNTAE